MNVALEEISENWKLEAREEDNERYFYFFNEVSKIMNGKKSYVIGRKGTGKTAISEYISNLDKASNDIFTEKLKFKNYPFNDLYNLTDTKFTQPNQYITLWKYLIYSVVCKMMLRNPLINSSIQEILNLSYEPDKITALPRQISQWTSNQFEVLETTNPSRVKGNNLTEISWISKVDILEDTILQHLDDSKYYIVFDELDEDFRGITNNDGSAMYGNLMTSLFKAVQDIRSIFKDTKKQIFPIIFLRDDIYTRIKDSDKNKWSDFKIEIDWDVNKIKKLIAFRISKAFGKNNEILGFDEAWKLIFSSRPVMMGDRQKNTMSSFDFITRSTQLKPRDFIRYIQVCAEEAYSEGDSFVKAETVRKVDKAFSNYLKAEIEDEMFPIAPDISNVFGVISEIRKQTFSIDEFKKAYLNYQSSDSIIKESDINYILHLLYDFSVIGNQPKNNNLQVFRYKNREARLNFSENIVVHRGLFKALQIL